MAGRQDPAGQRVAGRLIVWASLYLGAFVLVWALAPRGGAHETGRPILSVSCAVAAIQAAVVIALARTLERRRHLLALGLGFLVFSSVTVALAEQWPAWPSDPLVRGVSWSCLFIVLAPVVVPARPRAIFVATFIAALATPGALAAATFVFHRSVPEATTLTALCAPPLLCAVLAFFVARMLSLEHRQEGQPKTGGYVLEETLGKGGMGEVFRARHAIVERPAAVKVVRPERVSRDLGEDPHVVFRRFEREARITASLTSPHVVTLYDFGITDDGAFYYVMELLHGQDLESLVAKEGPQDARRVVHFLVQACDALEEAHNRGLVHRDIKPSNFFSCRVGTQLDFLKVLDFGLVASTEAAETRLTRLTMEGLAAGTPAYMAPEMARGHAIDGRADIYALGCVAYYLLTGKPVFDDRSPLEVLRQHVRTPPKPPSVVRQEELPPQLEQIVLDCLEKDPERRPAHAKELADRLSAIDLAPWSQQNAEAARLG